VFEAALSSGGVVKAIRVPDGKRISNSRLKAPKGDVVAEAMAAGEVKQEGCGVIMISGGSSRCTDGFRPSMILGLDAGGSRSESETEGCAGCAGNTTTTLTTLCHSCHKTRKVMFCSIRLEKIRSTLQQQIIGMDSVLNMHCCVDDVCVQVLLAWPSCVCWLMGALMQQSPSRKGSAHSMWQTSWQQHRHRR
jgi:hypothetical protein